MRNALLILCAVLVSACSDSDTNAVKDGRLDAYPEFTISQAFDNRTACERTEWQTVTDNRNREIVRYTCHFKGVGDAFQKQAKTELESATKQIESRTFSYEVERISKAKAMIASLQADFAIAEAALAKGHGPKHDEIIERYNPRIAQLEAILREIESRDVDALIAKGIDHFNWPEGYESHTNVGFLAQINQIISSLKRGSSPNSTAIIAMTESAERQKPLYEEDLQRRIKELVSERDGRLKSDFSSAKRNVEHDFPARIASEQEDIDSTEARMAEDIQSMNSRLEKAKLAMDHANDSSAFEYFEWTISEDGKLYTIGGGIKLKQPGEAEFKSLLNYSNYHAPFKAVYENKAKGFADYHSLVSTISLLNALGR